MGKAAPQTFSQSNTIPMENYAEFFSNVAHLVMSYVACDLLLKNKLPMLDLNY